MASITVLAGDFLQGDGEYRDGVFTLRTSLHPWPGITLPLSSFKSVEVANEESINNIKDAIGFGVAGAMLLGVGLACLRQVFQPAAAAFVWCHVLMWLFLLFPYCGAWLVLRRKAA